MCYYTLYIIKTCLLIICRLVHIYKNIISLFALLDSIFPIECCRDMVIACILILFLILGGKHAVFCIKYHASYNFLSFQPFGLRNHSSILSLLFAYFSIIFITLIVMQEQIHGISDTVSSMITQQIMRHLCQVLFQALKAQEKYDMIPSLYHFTIYQDR